MKPLHADSLPLHGTHLIEASAGTGKTHTLATLYVRLIVERELDVARIALVTFTDAAARELGLRVRALLHQHASPLARLALQRFDAARIGTIHRLFRRLLDEFAFEVGRAPTRAEPSDGALTRTEGVRDYWRDCMVRMSGAEYRDFVAWCKNMETLDRRVQEVLRVPPEQRLPPADAQADVQQLAQLQALRARGIELRAGAAWVTTWAQLRNSDLLNRGEKLPFRQERLAKYEAAIDAWLRDADAAMVGAEAISVLREATQQAHRNKRKKEAWVTPDAAIARWADECHAALEEFEGTRRVRWLRDAADAVTAALAKARRERDLVTFDELILDLHRALHGEQGDRLARQIRGVLDVALVDEFQDTDAEQYAVFRRLFVDEPDGTLMVVGDPKQAIYRFRGGDVFAYRAAVHDAGEQRWALRSNWRSDAHLIEAVNAVFDAERVPDVFRHDFIAFTPADYANGEKQQRRAAHAWPTPLRFWLADGAQATNKPQRTAVAVRACADTIAELLRAATPPASMAVLARTNAQVDAVMAALQQRGIAAASRGKERLADTDMALELLVLFDALTHADDDGRQRAALATRMLGYDAAALRALDADGAAWSRAMAELTQLREAHARGGMARLMWRLLAQAAPRLLSLPEGGRHLGDLRQLAAWLVEAGAAAGGMAEATAWLARMRANKEIKSPERSTSDDQAVVHVLTMHKAKGLEWDVVFAPFLWDERDAGDDEPPVRFHDHNARLLVDLGSRDIDKHQALHAEEARAERARVIYVALTRARVACFVLAFDSEKAQGSVFEALLRGGPPDAPAQADVRAGLSALTARAPQAIAVLPLPTPAAAAAAPIAPPEVHARPWTRRIDRGFALLSYSALMSDDAADARDHDTYVQRDDDTDDNPRGARLGECVHGLLELALNRDVAQVDAADIDAHCLRFGFRGRARDVVRALVARALDATLDAAPDAANPSTRLRDVAPDARVTELEFHFAWRESVWDVFVAAYGEEPGWVSRLRRAPQGLFHGYIDLVYAHGARWYVLDYKTNDLGTADDAYAPAQLDEAVQREGYDVQALMYSLAVHRMLRQRLGQAYDYDQHYGGAWYWFVRGLQNGSHHGRHLARPPRALIDALDCAFAWSAP